MALKINCEIWFVIFATLIAILLRISTSLHPHSGESTPPMYGDYEAQRHWMEITTKIPLKQWYVNTTDNNLEYWGLDYPPLTAYHMYMCGQFSNLLNENFTKLHESRGYESETHKLFMRITVIIGDALLYIPALIWYYQENSNVSESVVNKKIKSKYLNSTTQIDLSLSTLLALFYPGIILIDHGHFQYNSISLGFLILATTFILKENNLLATVLFCLALNYKQMELYHALPFFFYLLSSCIPKPGESYLSGISNFVKIGSTVIFTFAIIWVPFLIDLDVILQVLHRQFPIDRGVFEDKVANIWCTLNILFKFKVKFDNHQMLRICLFSTLAFLFPSCCDLFLHPSKKKFVLALINSSLAFFLFSFQVHEKSILLVAIPVLLYFPHDQYVCFWFLYISTFSMLPLFIKDKLIIAFFALVGFYLIAFRVSIENIYHSFLNTPHGLKESYNSLKHAFLNLEYKQTTQSNVVKITLDQAKKNSEIIKKIIFHVLMLISIILSLFLCVISVILEPPQKYPDLFSLAISVYSCIHFFCFFIYFNLIQLKIPHHFDDIKTIEFEDN